MKKNNTKATPHTPRKAPRRRTPAGHLPNGWTQKRADEIARYYDNQSDDDAIAEAEAAYNDPRTVMIQIPIALLPQVQKLLKRRAG